MQKSFLSVKSFCVATLAGIGFASFLAAQPSLAQLNTIDAYPGDNSQDNTNPFSPNSGNLNPLDLIHRAQFGSLNWNAEQKNDELNSAVAELNRKRAVLKQNANQPVNNTAGQAVPGLPAITSPSVVSPVQIVPPQN
ncbi:hypothetical protein H6G80_28230 [Nostoc sp. FACHB-87]|uniref:hypothetical protein n=1 Tax=Nostocales TaxID=1161 RepID=UPI0016883474|nr:MULTISPECIES: hypothetical protein [Nostocales]MBD2297906.1 hypothetical protein [Nostoc sp. FACHB-190]MBD2457939.1 hypothetical protein [Nostoc sp. FACHB-87]MBD2479144.1 hypothetical protein [Anabaena sp. FACHB-83]MBD2489814.1 hypothetical protein [Aulosira sp. FACHB-615]